MLVLHEETVDSPKINARKEVLEVRIENPATSPVVYCICLDREASLKAVRKNALRLHFKLRFDFELAFG